MSNEKPAAEKQTQSPPAPKIVAPPGAVRMRSVMFASPSFIVNGINPQASNVVARDDERRDGCDIWWFRDDRHYRFERYRGGELAQTAEVHELHVSQRVRW